MAAVNHDHLEARPLGKTGGVAVGLDDVLNLLTGQGLDGDAVGTHPIAGAELAQALLLVLVHQVGTSVLAGMAQLHAGHGAVTGDCIGRPCPAGKAPGGGQVQVEHMGSVGLGMHHQLAGGDGSSAALGPQLIEAGGSGADTAVGGDIRAAHRCGEHAVAEGHPAQSDGLAQIGVFLNHVAFLLGYLAESMKSLYHSIVFNKTKQPLMSYPNCQDINGCFLLDVKRITWQPEPWQPVRRKQRPRCRHQRRSRWRRPG